MRPSARLVARPGEPWESSVPARQCARFSRFRRRIERQTRATFACAREGRDAREAVEDVLRLHVARWSARDGRGQLGDGRTRDFLCVACAAFAGHGALRAYRLFSDDACVAGLLGFVEKDALSFYLQGFDPDVSRRSPGMVLIGLALEDATREGITTFDFLHGRDAYKYEWGAVDVPVSRRRLVHAERRRPELSAARA